MTLQEFQEKILKNDYCIGCGVCALLAPDEIKITLTEHGFFRAEIQTVALNQTQPSIIGEVCPFSSIPENEDQISDRVFPKEINRHPVVGAYHACYAGSVTDSTAYANSSSGGLARWILRRLLEKKLVDAVIQVTETPAKQAGDMHYQYAVARTAEQVSSGGKSAYYPVEMSQVLTHVLQNPGRYVITGVPCFIKAIRNLCRVNPIFSERIIYTVGIVCGHLKSKYYAEMIGWQMGVEPTDLERIDFRVKVPGKKANEKGVQVKAISSSRSPAAKTVHQLFGTNYGHGFFKYNACDFCDDILAETADVAIGDAWLPKFINRGTSLAIVRNKTIQTLLDEGVAEGTITLQAVSVDEAALSQDAGVRHRREGLSYRLHLKLSHGQWFPKKRVNPAYKELPIRNRFLYWLRLKLASSSPKAFYSAKKKKSWRAFRWKMAIWVKLYSYCYRFPNAWAKINHAYTLMKSKR